MYNNYSITNETPLAALTVGQFKDLFNGGEKEPQQTRPETENSHRYGFGMQGIAETFGCSLPTAHRLKRSGKIDAAIKQIGRKIIIDKDLALELTTRKTGGR